MAAKYTSVIRSVRGAESVALSAARATGAWTVRISALYSLSDAPAMVALLDPLRVPAPPRALYTVTPIRKLKAAARISTYLSFVTARINLLLPKPYLRYHYSVLCKLAKEIRASARLLPHPERAVFVGMGNRVRRLGARGRKRGGYPARHFRHLLRGLATAVARLQTEPIDLLLDTAAADRV